MPEKSTIDTIRKILIYSFYGCLLLIASPICCFLAYATYETDFSELTNTAAPKATSRYADLAATIVATNPPKTSTPKPQAPQAQVDEVFDQMELAFEGNPMQRDIKRLLDPILLKFDLELNADNYSRTASVLVGLRLESERGVTEMEVLRWLSTFDPPPNMELPDAMAIAFADLESQ